MLCMNYYFVFFVFCILRLAIKESDKNGKREMGNGTRTTNEAESESRKCERMERDINRSVDAEERTERKRKERSK